ncbi:hypothetical protein EDD80_10612 [Anseongella ginsenosidimutans]|uniref:Uncharacterized protein n=1 Tax=Anseongella ginsenosidimutans TaxID=496056 RepID=A0A4R3KQT1_9SPHI|nr:hypothetical protein EDD80_10612 [Anseongella ginsenosidimutans]
MKALKLTNALVDFRLITLKYRVPVTEMRKFAIHTGLANTRICGSIIAP